MAKRARKEPSREAEQAMLIAALAAALARVLAAPDEMTVTEAADAAGVTYETIRAWARTGQIGRWDARLRRFLITRSGLRTFLERHWGHLPPRVQSALTQASDDVALAAMTNPMDPLRNVRPKSGRSEMRHA